MGLATAVNRLKDSSKKKHILPMGSIMLVLLSLRQPLISLNNNGIKVYTIGLGSNGMAESPYAVGPNGQLLFQMMKLMSIDEKHC
jgi:Ca-activated chloride channel family protein